MVFCLSLAKRLSASFYSFVCNFYRTSTKHHLRRETRRRRKSTSTKKNFMRFYSTKARDIFIYFLREWTNAHELIPNINLYICMKICYIVFECDIFCGCCWMNYENECNALYYLAYDTFFFSSSSTFFSAGFKCCWCVISKRAHTHRLTRSGFRFPFIDAFAINILCATKTMVFNNAMRRLLLLFWNQKLVFVSFSINKIISYCNRLAGWAWA